jgi:predicted GNAT family acetyltransferase
MQLDVQHDPDAFRFHVPPEALDGDPQHKMANMGTVLSYHQVGPRTLEFRSTLVPPHLRAKGVGSELVRSALDWARKNDFQVIPTCPFVAHFIEEHPEYGDLVPDLA